MGHFEATFNQEQVKDVGCLGILFPAGSSTTNDVRSVRVGVMDSATLHTSTLMK
jgi:hypothetical protein